MLDDLLIVMVVWLWFCLYSPHFWLCRVSPWGNMKCKS